MRHLRCLMIIILAATSTLAFAAKSPLQLTPLASKIGKYQKIEFKIDIDAAPGETQTVIGLEVQTPSGKTIELPAFWMQNYEYKDLQPGKRGGDWHYPIRDGSGWRARFAPMETGTHKARAVWKNESGETRSNEVSFECTPSDSKGFIRVARANPRYFEYSDGSPFLVIGQDLAFIGDSQYVGIAKMREIFGKLSANGANYLRIWTCCGDWGMAIEARKSAFGRSWEKKSPLVDMPLNPGKKCVQLTAENPSLNISPSHTVGLKPNTRYIFSSSVYLDGDLAARLHLTGGDLVFGFMQPRLKTWVMSRREFTTDDRTWRLPALRITLENGATTAYLADFSLKENGIGPELLWEADTNRPARGYYNPTDCFMLDQVVEEAGKNGIKLQLCTMTRDLYMKDLKDPKSPEYEQAIADAKKTLRYAVARWGYSTAVASWEYWNEENPGLPTDRFYEELGKYLKEIDPFGHLRATSAWGPNPKDWRHPELDVADLHWYLRPTWGELSKDEVAAVLDRAALVRGTAAGRPALLSEFGLANDKWGQSENMAKDEGLGHFHNALWASALSGLSGTAMFWWWEQLDRQDAYRHYKGISAFAADIPFNKTTFQPVAAAASDERIRVIGLQSAERADLWISNREAAWHRRVVEGKEPGEIRGATLEISGLAPGARRVQWWDTMEGKVIREAAFQPGPGARLVIPPFMSDIACKVLPPKTR